MQDYRRHIPIWVAAIESGYLKTPAWVSWIERHVLSEELPQSWSVDLYRATDAETALSVLYSAYPDASEQEPILDGVAATLGFLYLRYRNGEITLTAFLSKAGAEADNQNYDFPTCESIYRLLTRCEQAAAQGQSDAPYKLEAQAMFARHRSIAERWLQMIGLE